MKRSILVAIIFFILFSAVAQEIPGLPGLKSYCNDFAGILTPGKVAFLEKKLKGFDKKTSARVVVITVKKTDDQSFDEFAKATREKLNATKKKKEKIILVLIKTKTETDDGQVFISSDSSLASVLPDPVIAQIIEVEMRPGLTSGNYFEAINNCINTMICRAGTEYAAKNSLSDSSAVSNYLQGLALSDAAIAPGNETTKNESLLSAFQYLRKAVAIQPRYTEALLLLGNGWWNYTKNFDSTFFYYKRIVAQNCEYNQVYFNLFKTQIAQLFNIAGRVDTNIRILEELYALCPKQFDLNYQLGVQYGKFKGNIEKSISFLEQAVKINPTRNEAFKDLGVAYGFSGNYDKAIENFEMAMMVDPNDHQVMTNLAFTWLNKGNNEKAVECLSKVMEMDINDPAVFTNVGNIFQKLGNADKAKQCFEKAEELKKNKKE